MSFGRLPYPNPNLLPVHRVLGGGLAASAAIANGVAVGEIVNIAYGRFLTVRFKATQPGSLQLDYIRPLATEPILDSPAMPLASYQKYTVPASPAAVAIVSNVENVLQATTNGEFWCLLTFTPSAGPGTITYCDVCMV